MNRLIRNKKLIVVLGLALTALLILVLIPGCGKKSEDQTETGKPTITSVKPSTITVDDKPQESITVVGENFGDNPGSLAIVNKTSDVEVVKDTVSKWSDGRRRLVSSSSALTPRSSWRRFAQHGSRCGGAGNTA